MTLAAPYDKKNADDYRANSQAIEEALQWMEANVDQLRSSQISLATLSRKTNLHRNTLRARGAWIKERLQRITNLKETSQPVEERNEISKEDKILERIKKLENSLDLQRQETARVFFRKEELKRQLEESESALDQLAKKNILLQEENESLLKRLAANVTSISARKDSNRRG